jgi:hypothetical protein
MREICNIDRKARRARPGCGISATVNEYFQPVILQSTFRARMLRRCNTSGDVFMGIDTVLLIVILTFGIGFVLDRLAMGLGRLRRRAQSHWRRASSGMANGMRKRPG